MTALPDCNHDLTSPMAICSRCFIEFLEQAIGNHLQQLIEATIPKDIIDVIQSYSKLYHSGEIKYIDSLADTEEDLEYESKHYRDHWKGLKNQYKGYKIIARKDSMPTFLCLVLYVLQDIENCILDMNQRYNVNPENALTAINRHFSDSDGTIFAWLVAKYYLNKSAYLAGIGSISKSYTKIKDIMQFYENKAFYNATMNMIDMLKERSAYTNMGMKSPYGSAIRISFSSLVGWASTAIHPKFFKENLEDNVTDESSSDPFLKTVMSAALIACHDIDWNQNFQTIQTELKRQISKSLSMDGPKRPSGSTRPATEPWQQRLIGDDPTSRALEEWQARERAAQEELDALCRAVNLGPGEARVFELLRQELTEQEIAKELGIAVGTVKSTKSRILKKIRRAGNI